MIDITSSYFGEFMNNGYLIDITLTKKQFVIFKIYYIKINLIWYRNMNSLKNGIKLFDTVVFKK